MKRVDPAMPIACVYGLFRKSTHELFYVGRTVDLRSRIDVHKSKTFRHIRDDFYAEILERSNHLKISESFWIGYALFLGCKLLNKQLNRHKEMADYYSAFKLVIEDTACAP